MGEIRGRRGVYALQHFAQALERDARLVRTEAVCGDAHVERVFNGDNEFHQRQRVQS